MAKAKNLNPSPSATSSHDVRCDVLLIQFINNPFHLQTIRLQGIFQLFIVCLCFIIFMLFWLVFLSSLYWRVNLLVWLVRCIKTVVCLLGKATCPLVYKGNRFSLLACDWSTKPTQFVDLPVALAATSLHSKHCSHALIKRFSLSVVYFMIS